MADFPTSGLGQFVTATCKTGMGPGAELLFVDEKLNKQSFRNRPSLRPFKRN